MKPRFPRHSEPLAAAVEAASAAPAGAVVSPRPEFRACCCPGRPVVRVTMPASAARPRPADLLLCGHHYRVSQPAIEAAGATIEALPGRSADAEAALLTRPARPA